MAWKRSGVQFPVAPPFPPGAVCATEAPWHPLGLWPPRPVSPRLAAHPGATTPSGGRSRHGGALASARVVASSPPFTTPAGPFAARPLPPGAVCATEAPWHHLAVSPPLPLSPRLAARRQICGAGRGAPATDPARSEKCLKRGPHNGEAGARAQARRLRHGGALASPPAVGPLAPFHHPPWPIQRSASVDGPPSSQPRWQKRVDPARGARCGGTEAYLRLRRSRRPVEEPARATDPAPREKMLEARAPTSAKPGARAQALFVVFFQELGELGS